MDDLAKLPPDEYPWVVNFVINRADRLINQGRWQEALAASDVAKPVAAIHGSDFARMLVAAERACALDRLGRNPESEVEMSFVRAHYADAPSEAIDALLCAGHDDEAAALFLRVLDDAKIRSKLLGDLKDERFDLFWSGPRKIRTVYVFMKARPELEKAASKYIRTIPERFVPLAYLRRQALAQLRKP
jgi:hypothetical protein